MIASFHEEVRFGPTKLFNHATLYWSFWTKSGKWTVMYMCPRDIDFVSFYDFSIEFWNCSDSVVFLVFVFFTLINLIVPVVVLCFGQKVFEAWFTRIMFFVCYSSKQAVWHISVFYCIMIKKNVVCWPCTEKW